MLNLKSYTQNELYDCIECGQENSVLVKGSYGFCKTPGCLNSDPIQFVFFPKWKKPKASRAGRELLWLK
jgi:hypothetical protein